MTTLSPTFRTELTRALERQLCLVSLYEFVERGWHVIHGDEQFIGGWHIEEVCRLVQAMVVELIKARRDPTYVMDEQNLLVNIPPRSSKTMVVQVFAIAWMWLHDPAIKVRCISGTPSVVNDASRHCRELIGSDWYRETFKIEWAVDPKVDGVEKFANTRGGFRACVGIQGKITGAGSDVIIMDDPHDAKDVESETVRKSQLKKWDVSIRNRTNNARARLRIGIMQRLHELDWSGHVLSKGGWIHARIPMEFEVVPWCKCETCSGERVPKKRFRLRDRRTSEGELMQPSRFDRDFCNVERTQLGEYGYAGQMQQRPSPDEGGMFKRKHWRFWKPDGLAPDHCYARPRGCVPAAEFPPIPLPPRFAEVIISIDCTFGSVTASADYVAAYVIGRVGANRFVLDRRHGKMTYIETKNMIRELCAAWPIARAKIVEKAANGAAVINDLNAEIGGMIGFSVGEHGPKESRAQVMSPSQEAGNWFLPEGAPWLDQHVDEFAVFPNGAHDDCVDSCSQAEIRFQGTPALSRLVAAYG